MGGAEGTRTPDPLHAMPRTRPGYRAHRLPDNAVNSLYPNGFLCHAMPADAVACRRVHGQMTVKRSSTITARGGGDGLLPRRRVGRRGHPLHRLLPRPPRPAPVRRVLPPRRRGRRRLATRRGQDRRRAGRGRPTGPAPLPRLRRGGMAAPPRHGTAHPPAVHRSADQPHPARLRRLPDLRDHPCPGPRLGRPAAGRRGRSAHDPLLHDRAVGDLHHRVQRPTRPAASLQGRQAARPWRASCDAS